MCISYVKPDIREPEDLNKPKKIVFLMILVDAHAHLDHKQFERDLEKVIERAKAANIKAIINNGLNPETNRKTLEIASEHKMVKAALGFYPTDAVKSGIDAVEEEIKFIEKNKDKIIAIGEVGLDYHWLKGKDELQKEIFEKFIGLAKKLDKPLIVHSREAEKDAVEILEKHKCKKVMMHCFNGGLELAKRCEKNGWYISIPCNVVRSSSLQKIVKEVNINKLLTETDCPLLSAVPGERNEPSKVIGTIEKIAEIKGMDKEEVANNIFLNYQNLFL